MHAPFALIQKSMRRGHEVDDIKGRHLLNQSPVSLNIKYAADKLRSKLQKGV